MKRYITCVSVLLLAGMLVSCGGGGGGGDSPSSPSTANGGGIATKAAGIGMPPEEAVSPAADVGAASAAAFHPHRTK